MENLEMQGQNRTLVDMVEEKLLLYLKDNNYCIGCTVPNEKELAYSLGVARSVIREGLCGHCLQDDTQICQMVIRMTLIIRQ